MNGLCRCWTRRLGMSSLILDWQMSLLESLQRSLMAVIHMLHIPTTGRSGQVPGECPKLVVILASLTSTSTQSVPWVFLQNLQGDLASPHAVVHTQEPGT